jgi:RNA polymerase sigma-70 factor, ECF subfamily
MPTPVTELLIDWRGGNEAAGGELLAQVYEELRRIARGQLARERGGHTLQPTALVHEAYLRLVDQTRADWANRSQFFAVASRMMRRILVDHARAGRTAKRGGHRQRVTLDEEVAGFGARGVDILDLDRALTRFAELDPRKCRVAELRFFSGLSLTEIGQLLDVSIATVERDWTAARAWLYAELTKKPGT